ncbi:sulfite exporter TauE/SafE family protein [Ramlibacter sp. MMS24-I3-19]|uniref:sulfite exporter TauE/SafE family protein n=1 Tax=Ramlibacter sp. MMS24-I3-19 TaxID=3416606 RepID=UPI003CFDE4F7
MTPELLGGIALAFFVAGAVKGVAGMGLPVVAMGLLSLAMPPAAAAGLLIVPALATNVVQCLGPHLRRLAMLLGPMWIGVLVGCRFTPLPSLASGASAVRVLLGGVMILYSAYGLARPTFRVRLASGPMAGTSAVVGLTTGMLTAATGINIFPMTMFLQSLDLRRDELIQALGLSFTVCTLALANSLGWQSTAVTWSTAAGWIALLAAFGGLGLGNLLRARVDPALFRRLVFGLFGLLGLAMLAKELL